MTSDGPAYPAPSRAVTQSEMPARPRTVQISFWLYVLTALLGLVGMILSISSYPALRATALEQVREQLAGQGQEDLLPAGTFETILDVSFGIGIAIGVVGILLYVLFGILAFRGANWARIVLTVLAGLSVLLTILGLATSAMPVSSDVPAAQLPVVPGAWVLSIAQQVSLVVATVLLWLPASNDWFRRMKEHRRARRDLALAPQAPPHA
jgi:amino acid transporter